MFVWVCVPDKNKNSIKTQKRGEEEMAAESEIGGRRVFLADNFKGTLMKYIMHFFDILTNS